MLQAGPRLLRRDRCDFTTLGGHYLPEIFHVVIEPELYLQSTMDDGLETDLADYQEVLCEWVGALAQGSGGDSGPEVYLGRAASDLSGRLGKLAPYAW